MNMRILYITDIFPTISQIFISREIFELEKKGNDICVLSIHRPQEIVTQELNSKLKADVIYGDTIRAQKAAKGLRHCCYLLTVPIGYFQAFRASKVRGLPGNYYKFTQLPLVCDKIRDFKANRIHCHFGREGMLYGWLVSKMLNIPFSVTLHGSDALVDPYGNLGVVLRDADKVICVSEQIRNTLQNRFGVSPVQTHLVRCGVCPADFFCAAPLSGSLKILCVARLHSVKGLIYLIEACGILRERNIDFECTIYGEGPERDSLEKRIKELELESVVKLPGAISNEQLPVIYARHSLFVLPSLSEGAGVVLMEAMASYLPVVASNVGGIPEIVEDKVNGLLIEPEQPDKLAEAIEKTYNSRQEVLQRMGKRNRLKVEQHFNAKNEIDKLYTLFCDKTAVQGWI
jgi:glycosyltransferase involved in cell wall biosynthesis